MGGDSWFSGSCRVLTRSTEDNSQSGLFLAENMASIATATLGIFERREMGAVNEEGKQISINSPFAIIQTLSPYQRLVEGFENLSRLVWGDEPGISQL